MHNLHISTIKYSLPNLHKSLNPKIALNFTHKFCSIFIRNTVQQGRCLTRTIYCISNENWAKLMRHCSVLCVEQGYRVVTSFEVMVCRSMHCSLANNLLAEHKTNMAHLGAHTASINFKVGEVFQWGGNSWDTRVLGVPAGCIAASRPANSSRRFTRQTNKHMKRQTEERCHCIMPHFMVTAA